MKTADAVAAAVLLAAAGAGGYYLLKGNKCRPPTGGCPSGTKFDSSLCQCVQGQTYTVGFLVEDGTTKAPIANAAVLFGATPGVTGLDGTVSFSGIAAGNYLLSVSATGYQYVSENVAVSASQTSFTVDMSLCAPPLGGCSCGSVFSPSACTCVKQLVGFMNAPPSVLFGQNWYAHINGILFQTSVLCAGTTPGGDPDCNGKCGSSKVSASIDVQVLDANGAPVCGVLVDPFLSSLSLPWSTSDGNTWGHFNLLVDSSKTTDSSGMATFNVTYQIVVDGTKGPAGTCLIGCCGPSTLFGGNFNVVFTAQARGTAYKAITTVGMSSSLFVYYYS